MKFKLLTFLALIVTLVGTAACSVKPTPTQTASGPPDLDWNNREIFQEGLVNTEQEALDDLPVSTVYHIDLKIPDDFVLLQGHEQVRYVNQEHEALNEIYFRLFPNVTGGKATVSAVKVDEQDVEPIYELGNSAVRVPLATALEPDQQIIIQMDFTLEVPREMGGNYGLFGYFNDVLVLDEFYPTIAVYDDNGWNVEIPPTNGDITFFDASFYVVRVTAPAKLTVVASGIKVEHEREADEQILTFAAGPSRDFYLAASERYTVFSETVGETKVNSYAFSERADGARRALQHAVDALKSFNTRFGTYPYTEFDLVSTPMQALGIEYPGVVGIALNLYDPEAEIWGLPSQVMIESTVAHEVAHQWFYNTVGNNQVDEPWLDEALAQYATGLYFADMYGERAGIEFRNSWYDRWNRVEQAAIPIGMPSGNYQGQEYGAIVYGRGPIFVTVLAQELGKETFDEFLRDYYETNKWGIGTTTAFEALATDHCQCDLTPLFEEWVYEK